MDMVILGAGLSGLALADQLSKIPDLSITVIEKESIPGGMARSFQHNGIWSDLGSHRLHPNTPPDILDDLRSLIAEDLLLRKRNGVLCLQGKKVRFPLQPLDALTKLNPLLVAQLLRDMVFAPFRSSLRSGVQLNAATVPEDQDRNFKDVLLAALGPTLCRSFYFPYAHKLWGLPPEQLSDIQARRRISSGSLGQIAAKMFRGNSSPAGPMVVHQHSERHFYYPKRGSGQIASAIANRLQTKGVNLLLDAEVKKLSRNNGRIVGIELKSANGTRQLLTDWIFSTLPITQVAQMFDPPMPDAVLRAAASLTFRAMVLVYIEIGTPRLSPWDAYYCPEPEILCSRMSEPKNYSGALEPLNRTILCLEVPCTVGDSLWNASPEDLKLKAMGTFQQLGFFDVPSRGVQLNALKAIRDVFTVKLPHAYPIYTIGFQKHLHLLLGYLDSLENFTTFGRQGLFWYANMHHVIQAGHELGGCFDSGQLLHHAWHDIRRRMDKITVAD
jgi:protoporphyrinogen oxidase